MLAGGTDLMPQNNAGKVPDARTLLNIKRVEGLDGIAVDDGVLVLGTLVTIAQLQRHPLVKQHAAMLADAADHFASQQIRNSRDAGRQHLQRVAGRRHAAGAAGAGRRTGTGVADP